MEYVFGRMRRGGVEVETVRTAGRERSELSGRTRTVRELADSHISDVFTVVGRLDSAEGADGTKYDWYEITDHYRYEDRHTPQIGRTEEEVTELEIAAMELEQAVTDNEIAIMELREGRN